MQTKFNTLLRLACLALLVSSFPRSIFAHATPLQYVPAASSVLGRPPAQVAIHFSERVEPRVSSIAVLAPDGSRADLGNSAPDAADPRNLLVSLKDRGPGTYTVSWEVISADDGHFAKGAYVFSVGAPQPGTALDTGGFQTLHSSGVPEAATLALELIGDALVLGALLGLALIWRPLVRNFPALSSEEPTFIARFRILFFSGCTLALAGGLVYLIFKTSELATLQETNFARTWVPFLSTASAISTVLRMAGAVALLAIFAISGKKIIHLERASTAEYCAFAILALIDFARARISHAAASTFAPGFGVAMNFIHLFFKDAWIGGIIALVCLFSPIVRNSRNTRAAAFALTSFSKIASAALGIAGVSGVYVVWLHLKSFSFVMTTDWGKRFAVLSMFAALLLAARIFHQLYAEPNLSRAIRTNDGMLACRIFSQLGFTLPFEAGMGIAILAVTSLLIITTPPLAPHYSFGKTALSEGTEISLREQPYESGKFLVTVSDARTNAGTNVNNLVVTLGNRAAGIGPITAPVEPRFTGGYVFEKNLLAPAGEWTINISAQRSGAYDAAAAFDVSYPREIEQSDARAEDRTFGSFEIIQIIAALLLVILSAALYRHAAKGNQFALAAEPSGVLAAPAFTRQGAWIAPALAVVAVLYITGGFPVLFRGVLESSFQRSCEDSNIMNMWHESVPERDGRATSDLALPGCTTGIGLGQFHFVDPREFAYFIRPARAKAQLALNTATVEPGVPTQLTFALRDLQGNPVRDLVLDHNRIVHVVIASADFQVFAHIHPEDFAPLTGAMREAAEYSVRYTFPKAGRYLVSVDFMERAYAFSDQFYLNAGQTTAPAAVGSDSFPMEKPFDGYDVKLKTSPATLKAGAPATLDYHFDENGQPATNLNPYLAVPMHLSIIREDLGEFLHIHGLLPVSLTGKLLGESIHASHLFLPDHFGPDIEVTNFSFPTPGVYHVFGEVSAGGKVVVTQFVVKVE